MNQTALDVGHGKTLRGGFWPRRGWEHKALLLAAALAAPAQAQDIVAIARGASASAVLGAWCAARHLGPLIARRESGAPAPAGPAVRRALNARPGDAVAYRRVTLSCGGRMLSRAQNWYLPDALTLEMNRALVGADAPFGAVVRPLGFRRVTLGAAQRQIRAVLVRPDGKRFSYVIESYAPPG
ncbi:MAG TPA: hypothetical protein VGH15_03010 [Caulobacteraceae bacterium]